MDKIMGPLQKLGKALMGAVAVLPVAALMMGVGYFLENKGGEGLSWLADIFQASGGAVLDNLGVIFAIAIAFGLAKDSNGAAALSGFIGFSTVTKLVGPDAIAGYKGIENPEALEGRAALDWAAQGWDSIGPGNVLLGIFTGLLAAWCYNRFHNTKLPDALAFFSGRRLVPIMTALLSIVLAGVFYVGWPLLYNGFFNFGQLIQGMGAVGAGIYGVVNRLLIPTGLHHALNAIFWFDVVGIDDIGKFLGGADTLAAAQHATDAASCPGTWDGATCHVKGVVGQYQAGFFPVMMFGLPGAALAITLRARPERRKVVGSLMLAGALASFLTGVTEPLEFSFMFAAPLLYVVHAVLMGISMAVASYFDWTAGFGFSAGLFDMLLSSQNPIANKWWMLLVLGVIYFFIYFGIFYLLIGWFKLKTPGAQPDADDEADAESSAENSDSAESADSLAGAILAGLGGAENVSALDYCTTRLRTTVKDPAKVDQKALERSGAAGVMRPSKTAVQVVIGPSVQFVYDDVAALIARGSHDAALTGEGSEGELPDGEKSKAVQAAPSAADDDSPQECVLGAPFAGEVIALSDVADEAFARGTVGQGFAVVPAADSAREALIVRAPAAGKVMLVPKTQHAVALKTVGGLEVLIHVGLDTVNRGGDGFEALVTRGQKVKVGQPLLLVSASRLIADGVDLTTPVVVTNKKKLGEMTAPELGDHEAGSPVVRVTPKAAAGAKNRADAAKADAVRAEKN